jgi:hypothetical protein
MSKLMNLEIIAAGLSVEKLLPGEGGIYARFSIRDGEKLLLMVVKKASKIGVMLKVHLRFFFFFFLPLSLPKARCSFSFFLCAFTPFSRPRESLSRRWNKDILPTFSLISFHFLSSV